MAILEWRGCALQRGPTHVSEVGRLATWCAAAWGARNSAREIRRRERRRNVRLVLDAWRGCLARIAGSSLLLDVLDAAVLNDHYDEKKG